MKMRLALSTVTGLAAIITFVARGEADPNLTNVPPHRHYVKTPSGDLVEVGPRVCGNPRLQKAFNEFHNNIHVATGSSIGPAAPGLHNFQGADLMAGGC